MKPIIGITMTRNAGQFQVNEPYVKAIIDAGGIPYCLPFGVEKDAAQIVQSLDGVLLTGGVDIHPHFFQEEPHPKLGEVMLERDQVEMKLTHAALNRKVPIFAICRGIQLVNVALGGTLYQDIHAQYEKNPILHKQQADRHVATHFIEIDDNSKLFDIVRKEKLAVNSLHHQAIKQVATVLTVVATSRDGIVEAVEMDDYPFCVAVQWHPEEMAVAGDVHAKKLFHAFVEAARKRKQGVKMDLLG